MHRAGYTPRAAFNLLESSARSVVSLANGATLRSCKLCCTSASSALANLTVLDLDFDVDTGRQLDALQAVDGLSIWLDDVDNALMNAHLKVLSRVFVDVWPTDHRVTVFVRRQRDRAANRRVGASNSLDDLL